MEGFWKYFLITIGVLQVLAIGIGQYVGMYIDSKYDEQSAIGVAVIITVTPIGLLLLVGLSVEAYEMIMEIFFHKKPPPLMKL